MSESQTVSHRVCPVFTNLPPALLSRPVSGQVLASGRLLDPPFYRSRGDFDDITAAPGRGPHHQPPPCDAGARSASVDAPGALDPAGLSGSVPVCSRGAFRRHPVSSSGTSRDIGFMLTDCFFTGRRQVKPSYTLVYEECILFTSTFHDSISLYEKQR